LNAANLAITHNGSVAFFRVPVPGAPQVPGTWDAWDGVPDALLQKTM